MSTAEKPLIVIVGATSKQGRSVAATLLQSHRFRIRALTRNKASLRARSLEKLSAEIVSVPFDLGLQKDLVAAFKGADGAFLMTPLIAPPETTEAPSAGNWRMPQLRPASGMLFLALLRMSIRSHAESSMRRILPTKSV